MTRRLCAIAVTLAVLFIPLVQREHPAHASGGGSAAGQTVTVYRQLCPATTPAPMVGTARFALDDQGGGNVNPFGLEIHISVTAGLPRTSYGVYVVGAACQVIVHGGMLSTDDSGRGDLDFHVLGSVVPPGTSVRVQLFAPAGANVPGPGLFTDVLTSAATLAP